MFHFLVPIEDVFGVGACFVQFGVAPLANALPGLRGCINYVSYTYVSGTTTTINLPLYCRPHL